MSEKLSSYKSVIFALPLLFTSYTLSAQKSREKEHPKKIKDQVVDTRESFAETNKDTTKTLSDDEILQIMIENPDSFSSVEYTDIPKYIPIEGVNGIKQVTCLYLNDQSGREFYIDTVLKGKKEVAFTDLPKDLQEKVQKAFDATIEEYFNPAEE